jgi:DnaJ-domain-containing protein 1
VLLFEAMEDSLYSVLGARPDATLKDIKRAYRSQALKFHPDRNPNNPFAEEQFKSVREAYDVLSDPASRAVYDAHLFADREIGSHNSLKDSLSVAAGAMAHTLQKDWIDITGTKGTIACAAVIAVTALSYTHVHMYGLDVQPWVDLLPSGEIASYRNSVASRGFESANDLAASIINFYTFPTSVMAAAGSAFVDSAVSSIRAFLQFTGRTKSKQPVKKPRVPRTMVEGPVQRPRELPEYLDLESLLKKDE